MIGGQLPPKPLPPVEKKAPEGATDQQKQKIEGENMEARLQYQEDNQRYWNTVSQVQNQIIQEGTQQSNMRKAEHDALMELARNLK